MTRMREMKVTQAGPPLSSCVSRHPVDSPRLSVYFIVDTGGDDEDSRSEMGQQLGPPNPKGLRRGSRASPHVKTTRITLETFRKLQPDMHRIKVESFLGNAEDRSEPVPGVERHVWETKSELRVFFKEGKVSGYSWQVK